MVWLALPESGTVVLLVRTFDSQAQGELAQRVEVEVETFSPNGPDYGPTVGVVQLSRDVDGTFSQIPAFDPERHPRAGAAARFRPSGRGSRTPPRTRQATT